MAAGAAGLIHENLQCFFVLSGACVAAFFFYQEDKTISKDNDQPLVNKNIKATLATTQKIIDTEVLNYSYGENDTIILNNNFTKRIRDIKGIIYEFASETWDLIEEIIEKLHNTLNKQNAIEIKAKRKIGRPKKEKAKDKNQTILDTFIKGKNQFKKDQEMVLMKTKKANPLHI